MNEEKQEVKGTVWLWTGLGLAAGGWLGMNIADFIQVLAMDATIKILTGISSAVGAIAIGTAAYRSSKKNNGGPPSWLWRSKKK
jgi:ammonia channel protein AmtB